MGCLPTASTLPPSEGGIFQRFRQTFAPKIVQTHTFGSIPGVNIFSLGLRAAKNDAFWPFQPLGREGGGVPGQPPPLASNRRVGLYPRPMVSTAPLTTPLTPHHLQPLNQGLVVVQECLVGKWGVLWPGCSHQKHTNLPKSSYNHPLIDYRKFGVRATPPFSAREKWQRNTCWGKKNPRENDCP